VDGVNAYAAGNQVVAIAASGRTALVVDPETTRVIRRIPLPAAASGAGVSPDGRTLAVGDAGGAVFIEDLATGRVWRGRGEHQAAVLNLAFSADGGSVASVSDDQDVMVWDVATGQLRLTLAGHSGRVLGAAFAPDGRTLYTDGLDASVIEWDVSGGRSFGVTVPNVDRGLPSPNSGPAYVGWSADRRRAVMAFISGQVADIDVATGRLVALDRPVREIDDLALAPDGRFAYIISTDGTLRRWDVAARRVDKASTLGMNQSEGAVAISPDGRLLAVTTQPAGATPVYLVNARTFRRVGRPIDVGFMAVPAFSRDGRLLGLGSFSGPGLAIVEVASGRIRWANRSFGDVLSLGLSPDGSQIVAGSEEGTIATFDAATGRRIAGPIVAHPGLVTVTSYSPGGRTILTSGPDGTARLWQADGLRPEGEPLQASHNAGALATFSPDGRSILALDATGRITTWEATADKWLARACSIVGHRDFTSEERTLFSIAAGSPRPCP
jgi:WD40 repeat protein